MIFRGKGVIILGINFLYDKELSMYKRVSSFSILLLLVVFLLISCKESSREVRFPDPVLEQLIREEISKPTGELTYGDLGRIKRLNFNGSASKLKIKELNGIENLKSLTSLGLNDHEIIDVTPLASLTSLKSLNLMYNRIEDIKALEGLIQLEEVYLSGNMITDLSPLKKLNRITSLALPLNRISDLSPLLNNSGLGAGDTIFIQSGNSISQEQIEALKSKGVDVNNKS